MNLPPPPVPELLSCEEGKERHHSNFNIPVISPAANNGEEKVVGTNPFEDDYDDTHGEKEVSWTLG